jgi:hypothetical protein
MHDILMGLGPHPEETGLEEVSQLAERSTGPIACPWPTATRPMDDAPSMS